MPKIDNIKKSELIINFFMIISSLSYFYLKNNQHYKFLENGRIKFLKRKDVGDKK